MYHAWRKQIVTMGPTMIKTLWNNVNFTFCWFLHKCTYIRKIYLIGQKFVRKNFRRTKYFVGQNFRHQGEISTLMSNFCLTFLLKHWTKFSTNKIFDTKPKFRQFCPIFAWLLYQNSGQNFGRTKVFVGQNFRHQAKISTFLSDEFFV